MKLLQIAALTSLTLVGCGTDPVVERTDLAAALQTHDVDARGVTVEPYTGRRFVLDAERGIFEHKDGAFLLHTQMAELESEGHVPESSFTDIAAIGDDVFALIARNDGFLYDRNIDWFRRHFCYVPGSIEDGPQPIDPQPEPDPVEPEPDPVQPEPIDPIDPGEDYTQLSNNLTFDPNRDRIVAQPQTFAMDDGALLGAHVGVFGRDNGDEQAWFELPRTDVDAGGIAVESEDQVLLGWNTSLWRFELSSRTLTQVTDLQGIVRSIDGLAVDETTGTVLVLDDISNELVEIDLASILETE